MVLTVVLLVTAWALLGFGMAAEAMPALWAAVALGIACLIVLLRRVSIVGLDVDHGHGAVGSPADPDQGQQRGHHQANLASVHHGLLIEPNPYHASTAGS